MLRSIYRNYVLAFPRTVLALICIAIAFLGYQATKLEVDASAETLMLEGDEDLRITRVINARYSTPDFLVITYAPKNDGLLADSTLENLRRLKKELIAVKGVASIVSILDVPLMESPPKPLKELLKDVPSLESHQIDKTLAEKEFRNSPIYKNLLVSRDFKITALQVVLDDDPARREFIDRRYQLREKRRAGGLSPEERGELDRLHAEFKKHRDRVRIEAHQTILAVRAVMDNYRGEAELFLGGVTMIADDLITFIKDDLLVFGLGVFFFLIITLWIIFRQFRWIVLPLVTCAFSVVATSGLLGMFGWEVTVISSNFISLQIIITMALTIHLIVRYRELVTIDPEADQRQLVEDTVIFMGKPCLFMVTTTIAGFSSLLLSGILPVINFGWMMSAGIAISLVLVFLVFPTVLVLLPKAAPNTSFENFFGLTKVLANMTENYGKSILVVSGIVLVVCVAGASRLMVENSFIDYFKENTDIYQGMKVIDQEFGGTTPFDVVLNFNTEPKTEPKTETQPGPKPGRKAPPAGNTGEDGEDEEDEEFDAFEQEFEEAKGQAQYWFTAEKMEEVEKIHDYLANLPETGKVLSLGTMLKVGKSLNDGDPLDNFALALLYNELPEKYRKIVLDPYVSVENNQVRFSILVRDSDPALRRNELLKKIKRDLKEKMGLTEDRFQVAGLLVLYNNMLQSLFKSQIMTLGVVLLALIAMFLILFRSLTISLIAILPNILSVGVVLGLMGWAKIPLDLMTITIAAISVGIAVDNTIHYIHRFKEEFPKDRNYLATMHRCHLSIGYAMYYTSITIIIGFSILVLSNFIPSIYFGLLTGLAMVIALLTALTLLPQLIIFLKPLGPEGSVEPS